MKRFTKTQSGFSLVELLAVVLILAVLAAVAIPLYINTRRAAAARACKANMAAIASAESAYALRNGAYTVTMTDLVGAPEGLSATVTCPLGIVAPATDADYDLTLAGGALTIACPNANTHAQVVGVAGDYSRSMATPAAENIP